MMKVTSNNIRICFCRAVMLIAVLGMYAVAYASYPIVENYPRKISGGGSQTWGAAEDSVGRLYFNNKDGVLEYDSRRWQLHTMPNGETVRSSLLDEGKNRLYVGSSDEFGYFSRNCESGIMEYHSLVGSMMDSMSSFNEVWHIHRQDSTVWFQSDFSIFRYDGGRKLLRMRMPGKVTTSALIGGELYVAIEGRGVYELQGTRIIPVMSDPQLKRSRIVALLPYRNSVMAVTVDRGLFVSTEGVFVSLPTDIDDFLKTNRVFSAAVGNGLYAFGTVLNGLVVKDFSTGHSSFANLSTGMQNNTVLSLFFDSDMNLWAGLDDGIDLVRINSPSSNLLSSSNKYGAGYMSLLLDNTIYLGTNQGLYATSYPTTGSRSPELEPIMQGQVWDIDRVGNDIIICSDNGVYYGKGRNFKQIPGIAGAWDAQQLVGHPDYILVSGYDSFHLLKSSDAGWNYKGKLDGYNDVGGHFLQEPDGTVWLSHWLRGLYRMRIDPELGKITHIDFYDSGSGLPTDRNNNVHRVGGQLIFSTEGGFYRFDGNSFHQDVKMCNQFGMYLPAKLVESPAGDLWCLTRDKVAVASRTASGNMTTDNTTYAYLASHLIPGSEDLNFLPDRHLIVATQDGFLDINLRIGTKPRREHRLIFDRLVLNGDSVVARSSFNGDMPDVRLSPGRNTVRFHFILPLYGEDNAATYSYCLENYDSEWSGYGATSEKEYTHLKPGDYRMKVRAMVPGSTKVYEAMMPITVLPPWYLAWQAKLTYFILSLLLLYGIRVAIMKYMKRSEQKMAERKERELEQMRRKAREDTLQKDYEIAHLKGAQLEQDVKHKAEELSNLTMNIVRKNEMLMDISNRLKKIQLQDLPLDANRQINKLHGIIRDNISHDDDWKNFVHNFDEAYEDFTKKLLAMHPGLTMVELRTCCYIKMGLSSKDIAPLFNISYRSVEMTRYRLRKKLGLDRSANLYDYLIKI